MTVDATHTRRATVSHGQLLWGSPPTVTLATTQAMNTAAAAAIKRKIRSDQAIRLPSSITGHSPVLHWLGFQQTCLNCRRGRAGVVSILGAASRFVDQAGVRA